MSESFDNDVAGSDDSVSSAEGHGGNSVDR